MKKSTFSWLLILALLGSLALTLPLAGLLPFVSSRHTPVSAGGREWRFLITVDKDHNKTYRLDGPLGEYLRQEIRLASAGPLKPTDVRITLVPKEIAWKDFGSETKAQGAELHVRASWSPDSPAPVDSVWSLVFPDLTPLGGNPTVNFHGGDGFTRTSSGWIITRIHPGSPGVFIGRLTDALRISHDLVLLVFVSILAIGLGILMPPRTAPLEITTLPAIFPVRRDRPWRSLAGGLQITAGTVFVVILVVWVKNGFDLFSVLRSDLVRWVVTVVTLGGSLIALAVAISQQRAGREIEIHPAGLRLRPVDPKKPATVIPWPEMQSVKPMIMQKGKEITRQWLEIATFAGRTFKFESDEFDHYPAFRDLMMALFAQTHRLAADRVTDGAQPS